MYGSCQRSAGMTPRYAAAALLMIARMAPRSSSRVGRISSPSGTSARAFDSYGTGTVRDRAPRRSPRPGAPARLLVHKSGDEETCSEGRHYRRVPVGPEVVGHAVQPKHRAGDRERKGG